MFHLAYYYWISVFQRQKGISHLFFSYTSLFKILFNIMYSHWMTVGISPDCEYNYISNIFLFEWGMLLLIYWVFFQHSVYVQEYSSQQGLLMNARYTSTGNPPLHISINTLPTIMQQFSFCSSFRPLLLIDEERIFQTNFSFCFLFVVFIHPFIHFSS